MYYLIVESTVTISKANSNNTTERLISRVPKSQDKYNTMVHYQQTL